MLTKYDTSYCTYEGPKVHSVVLSSVQLRSAASLLQSARWEKDWLLVSHNVKV